MNEILGQNWALLRKGLSYGTEKIHLWNHRAFIKIHFVKHTAEKNVPSKCKSAVGVKRKGSRLLTRG